MTIIDNGEGVRNYVSDAGNPLSLDYDGAIQIEVRGSTSSLLPKKQYALTTYDGLGAKQNVSILGMPEENDWILNGFAYDPSLMRDYISYKLSRQIGQYASRGVYCEVILNGEYQGLYVLQEKLKADDNRIDINKIDVTDNSGKDLTGGYITKADKTEGSDVAAWWMESYVDGYFTAFIHEHPKPTTVTGQQHNYIEGQFRSLEFAAGRYNNSLTNGYPSIIDLPSFIDFMLINELASNVDAYQFSTFFHKDRNGKLRAGPVWDFNLTYGNDLFAWGYDRSHTDVWQFYDGGNVGPRFWKDLFDEPTFKCYLRKRWLALTQPGQPLNANQIILFIDDVVGQIDEAVQRENMKWGTVGDHSAHVYNMKRWIIDRIDWMTAQLGQNQDCFGENVPNLVITKIHYHPMTPDGTGEKDREFIEITNVGDETADLTGVYFGGTGLVYQFPAGNRVLLANNMAVFKEEYGLTAYDEYSRSLNNGGQRIELLNGYGNLIDEVTYSDIAPWPVEADGQGYFLQVIDPAGDNNDPANWQAAEMLRTSVSSEAFEPRIEVYPNPTQRYININSNSPIKAVTLMDFEGRVLLQKQGTELSSQLNLAGLKTAIYLLTVQTDNGIHTQKILLTN